MNLLGYGSRPYQIQAGLLGFQACLVYSGMLIFGGADKPFAIEPQFKLPVLRNGTEAQINGIAPFQSAD